MPVRRTASIALALAAAGLVACGDDEGPGEGGPASVAPADTPIYLEATVDPDDDQVADIEALVDRLGSVPILGSPVDPGDLVDRAFEEISDELGEEVTFAEHVEPWLGERAGLAIGSLDEAEQDFAFAVEVTNEDLAREAIDRLAAADEAEEDEEREYEGVSYLVDSEGTAAGAFDGLLVVATQPAFEAAVDASGSDSLGEADGFTDAFEGLDSEALGSLYVDLSDVTDEAFADDPGDDPESIAAGRAALPEFFEEPMAAALDVNADSVVLDIGVAAGDEPVAPAQSDLLAEAPADAVAAVGIDDPARIAQHLVERIETAGQASGDEILQEGTTAQAFELQFGLSLEDALAEFGDGVAYLRGSLEDGGTATLELSLNEAGGGDGTSAAPQLLTQLGDVLESEGFKMGSPPDGLGTGFSARSVSEEGAVTLINAGIDGDRMVISVSATSSASVAGPGPPPEDTLGSNPAFGDAVAALGDDFEPLAFADPGAILGSLIAEASVFDVVTGEAAPEQAIPRFIADNLAYAVAGTRTEGDRLIVRALVGVE